MKRFLILMLFILVNFIAMKAQEVDMTEKNKGISTDKSVSIDKEIDAHIFRDISLMIFDEEKVAWGEAEKTGSTFEVKNLSVTGLSDVTNIYQISKYIDTQTSPVFLMFFQYHNKNDYGNFIYYCIGGHSKSSGDFSDNLEATITLQSDVDLSEVAKGKTAYLTMKILNVGIYCYICED